MKLTDMFRGGAMCAATLILLSVAGAQSWPKRYDHLGKNDTGECVAVDKRGNVYVAGTVSQSGGVKKDVVVISYTATGDVRSGWPTTYNGSEDGDDYATSIHVDDDLNVYVAGTSDGGSTSYDFFIWKLDTNGSPVWPASGSGTGWVMDSLGAVRTTSTGNEGFSEGLHVDMDVPVAASPANPNIAVTGTATTSGLGGTYWRTVVFEQNSAGTLVCKFWIATNQQNNCG